ncbi:MAG: thioredoxin family protein [Parachlamydiaceae bacterium]|nr:thioredoxin family protein [Parachlamydiaceae bacterium]
MFNLIRLIFCCFIFTLAVVIPIYNYSSESEIETQSAPFPSSDPVSVALISEQQTLQPGQPTWVAISMSIEDHWHAYWKNPGDAGMGPMITWNLPEGFEVGEVQWPTPKSFKLSGAVGFGYESQVVFLVQITPPVSFKSTSAVEISADMRWVVCSDSSCLPGEAHTSLTLPVTNETAELNQNSKPLFSEARSRMPKKQDIFKAARKQNGIALTFESSSNSEEFHEAYFFPEEKKIINHQASVSLDKSISNSPQHIVLIKEINPAAKISSLKGVLVLNTPTSSEAYEIDIIVGNETSPLISMNEPSLIAGEKVSTFNAKTTIDSPTPNDDFEFKGGLALALVFAFLGGMILNLMPCVLPVISLKVLSFVRLAGESRALIFRHGLAFSVGVLVSFWTLAGALLVLQAYGRSVGWGFQLQEPIFVAILASGLLIFALSLFGLFEIGTSLISAGGSARKKEGLSASFFSGILATAVATPCTGPFLGSAVGFAVTLPAIQAMLIFTFLGLGMAFPYLILAAFPQLLRFMPKAGNWMIAFKELMGFFMLATVLWLVWIFGAQTNSFALSLLLAGFFFMAFACWIYGRWSSPLKPRLTRYISLFFAIAIFSCGGYAVITASSAWAEKIGAISSNSKSNSEIAYANNDWEEFSVERISELRKQGVPIFVDFTAKWCLICQANHLVLTTDEVNQQFNQRGVVKMKADWTKNDSIIAAELRKFGRNSVPLYILYPSDSEEKPQILPQLLTPEIVMESLKQL